MYTRKTTRNGALLAVLMLVIGVAAIACGEKVVEKIVVQTVVVEKQVPGERVVETVIVEKIVPGERVVETVVVEKERIVEVVVTPTPEPKAPRGPVVWTIGFPEDITSTNVWDIIGPGSTAYNFYALMNQYPSLMGLSDVRFDYVPLLAAGFPTDVTREGEFFTAEVKIQPGAKWSDSEPIGAEDVAFTINTALEFELPGNWASNIPADVVDHVEAVSPDTAKFFFKREPGLAEWQYGVAQQVIVAEHYWAPIVENIRNTEANPEDRRQALFKFEPVDEPTAGEMMFQKWEPGAFVALEKNPQYFWADSRVNEYSGGAYEETVAGKTFTAYGDASGDVDLSLTRGVQADSVNFSIFSSQDAAILALRSGEIDYFLSPLGLTAGLKAQVSGQPGIATIQNPSNGFRYLGFNVRRKPMSDLAFRTAVATLIDKEFLTDKILQGAAFPIYTVVPEGNGFWWNKDVPQIGKGLDREARINETVTILKDAGYTWEKEPVWNAAGRKVDAGTGLRDPDGNLIPELEILAPSAGYDPLRATSAIWIEQWLKQAGIPVKANLTGFNVIIPRLTEDPEFNFDMWILGWGLTIYPDYVAAFFTTDQTVVGGLNMGGYSNAEFDATAKAFLSETDIEVAREKVFRIQQILAEELPYVTLFATPIIEAYRSDFVNFAYTDVLDGVQNYFQGINGPLATTSFME